MDKPKSIRTQIYLHPDDRQAIDWFRSKYGFETDSSVIRVSLRVLREVIEEFRVVSADQKVKQSVRKPPAKKSRWTHYKP